MKRLIPSGLPAVIPEIIKSIKGLVAYFDASDAALFDMIFANTKPGSKLPFELPSTMEVVRTQRSVI